MNYSKRDVAGMVTLYNSSPNAIKNIATYSNQVDKLYVIDNSEHTNPDIKNSLVAIQNLCYLPNNDNLGIAYALNKGAQKALEDGYRFLLTMDDDSKSPANLIEKMLSFLATQDVNKIGIVSVNHSFKRTNFSYIVVLYTMTSGNLLSLDVYRTVGPFNNELFIDHVDHEYGLRLSNAGFKIIELIDIKLEHKLGTTKCVAILGKYIVFISHSPERLFYFVRNGIYIVRKYALSNPLDSFRISKLIIKELIKMIFLESNKQLRYKYFFSAVKMGWQGKLGKMEN